MRNAEAIDAISAKIAAAITQATGTQIPAITAAQIEAPHSGPDATLAPYVAALTPQSIAALSWEPNPKWKGAYPHSDIRHVILMLGMYIMESQLPTEDHHGPSPEAGELFARPDDGEISPAERRARGEDSYLDQIHRSYWPDAHDGRTRTPEGEELATRELAAEVELAAWAGRQSRRDDLVRRALAAGVTKTRVQELTGISRSTINRIPGT